MVKERAGYQKHLKELARFSKREDNPLLFDLQEKMFQELSQKTKVIEEEIVNLIQVEAPLKQNYDLCTSVKGVGLILGVSLLVCTNNFSKFKTWPQMASYAGTAPFPYESSSKY